MTLNDDREAQKLQLVGLFPVTKSDVFEYNTAISLHLAQRRHILDSKSANEPGFSDNIMVNKCHIVL